VVVDSSLNWGGTVFYRPNVPTSPAFPSHVPTSPGAVENVAENRPSIAPDLKCRTWTLSSPGIEAVLPLAGNAEALSRRSLRRSRAL
jgi:hypothetical protein